MEKENEAFRQDNARLAKDINDIMTKGITLRELAVRNGVMTTEVATDMVAFLASLFITLLDDLEAPNYSETQLKERPKLEMELHAPAEPEKGFPKAEIITLTLQRWEGKTPHQLRMEAEDNLAKAKQVIAELQARLSKYESDPNQSGKPEFAGN